MINILIDFLLISLFCLLLMQLLFLPFGVNYIGILFSCFDRKEFDLHEFYNWKSKKN